MGSILKEHLSLNLKGHLSNPNVTKSEVREIFKKYLGYVLPYTNAEIKAMYPNARGHRVISIRLYGSTKIKYSSGVGLPLLLVNLEGIGNVYIKSYSKTSTPYTYLVVLSKDDYNKGYDITQIPITIPNYKLKENEFYAYISVNKDLTADNPKATNNLPYGILHKEIVDNDNNRYNNDSTFTWLVNNHNDEEVFFNLKILTHLELVSVAVATGNIYRTYNDMKLKLQYDNETIYDGIFWDETEIKYNYRSTSYNYAIDMEHGKNYRVFYVNKFYNIPENKRKYYNNNAKKLGHKKVYIKFKNFKLSGYSYIKRVVVKHSKYGELSIKYVDNRDTDNLTFKVILSPMNYSLSNDNIGPIPNDYQLQPGEVRATLKVSKSYGDLIGIYSLLPKEASGYKKANCGYNYYANSYNKSDVRYDLILETEYGIDSVELITKPYESSYVVKDIEGTLQVKYDHVKVLDNAGMDGLQMGESKTWTIDNNQTLDFNKSRKRLRFSKVIVEFTNMVSSSYGALSGITFTDENNKVYNLRGSYQNDLLKENIVLTSDDDAKIPIDGSDNYLSSNYVLNEDTDVLVNLETNTCYSGYWVSRAFRQQGESPTGSSWCTYSSTSDGILKITINKDILLKSFSFFTTSGSYSFNSGNYKIYYIDDEGEEVGVFVESTFIGPNNKIEYNKE